MHVRSLKNKHKVNFEYAATIFKDQRAISIYDSEHRKNEDRWITLGLASNGTLLIVNHTYKQLDKKTAIVRIISSRKATKQERKQYEE
ncbi:MAG: BrnT family toxin [Deltaproteobacteria bacterium]|nr:BrnT family toxin [Deltaproteobacteria bacterium]